MVVSFWYVFGSISGIGPAATGAQPEHNLPPGAPPTPRAGKFEIVYYCIVLTEGRGRDLTTPWAEGPANLRHDLHQLNIICNIQGTICII